MTVADLLATLKRRWPIMIACLFLTLAACAGAWRTPGVYWASTKVLFLGPTSDQVPNRLVLGGAAIPFAGLIEAEVNGGVPVRQATNPTVTLVDEGIFDGWSVLVPDTGGQWAHHFPESSLIVQSTGPSPAVVEARMRHLLDRITGLVTAHEDSAGVPPGQRVQLAMSPSDVLVQYSTGHPSRAVAVIVLLGVWLSLAACWLTDRLVATRRSRGR